VIIHVNILKMRKKAIDLRGFVLFILFLGSSSLFAQTDTIPKFSTAVSADLVSHYIWRGQDLGHTPSFQPGLSATWKDFTLGFWGAYRLGGSGDHETDFYLEKTIGPATFSIWDYWIYSESGSNNYFDYNKNTTSHQLEAEILLSGGEKLPFNLLGCYNFYGADPSKSMYLELQYLHSFGTFDTQVFAGFQPKGEFYASKAAFVNLGCSVTKAVQLTKKWAIPVSLSLITNPDAQKVYLVAGITIIDF
jgi:hypothetical protein